MYATIRSNLGFTSGPSKNAAAEDQQVPDCTRALELIPPGGYTPETVDVRTQDGILEKTPVSYSTVPSAAKSTADQSKCPLWHESNTMGGRARHELTYTDWSVPGGGKRSVWWMTRDQGVQFDEGSHPLTEDNRSATYKDLQVIKAILGSRGLPADQAASLVGRMSWREKHPIDDNGKPI